MNRSLGFGALIACALAAFLYAPLHRPLRAATGGRIRLTTLQKQMVLGGECYDEGGPCSVACYPEFPEFPFDFGGCWATFTEGDYDNQCDAKGCASSGCGEGGYVQYSQNWWLEPIGAVGSFDSSTYTAPVDCTRSIECISTNSGQKVCDNGDCRAPVPGQDFPPFSCQECASDNSGEWETEDAYFDGPCIPSGS